MTEILDRLFVGDWPDALLLKTSNPNFITAVLNVCENVNPDLDADTYMHCPFPDARPIPKDKFDLCMIWLNSQYYGFGRKVLIHCACGVSRSPTICAAFMTRIKLAPNIDKALEMIKAVRPQVNPAPLTFESARGYL